MILVVGGAGYIGSITVKELCNNGYECCVADNLCRGHIEAVDKRAKFVNADLLDISSLRNIFNKYKIDSVIHFAAFAYVGESTENPQLYYFNNFIGTLNLLKIMFEYNVKKLIFSSTCSTYGNPEYTPIDENHPQKPINTYARTKLMIEQALEDYKNAYGLKYIALRYFNAAGASTDGVLGESHEPETHIIPLVLNAIKNNTVFNIFGNDYNTPDGTCIRDYIHIEDLANAHKLALENLDKYCGYINIGTGIGTSVKEIIKSSEKITGKKCNINFAQRRIGDPDILVADNKKAKEILGWKPKYTNIEDTINTAWNWLINKKY